MKHATQAQFGRPLPAVLTPSNPDTSMIDKWEALKTLSEAAQDFGVTHRTLSVLKVLMTFLPERLIRPEHRSAIVFPSNKTLSERLNGMPDSTLRRHLATLVSAGIVSRHDSANRKRFARYSGHGVRNAFGFDLSPLARRYDEIRARADVENQRRETLQSLRAQVAQLRQQLLFAIGPCSLTEEAFTLLRRQPVAATLNDIMTRLTNRLEQEKTAEMNTNDVQNERHIENEIITYSVSKTVDLALEEQDADEPTQQTRSCNTLSLEKALRRLMAFTEYFPEPIRHWNDLITVADKLTRMMGIEASVFKESIDAMGAKYAAIAVLSILERFNDIENPGGYLRRLNQSAKVGRFNIQSMLSVG